MFKLWTTHRKVDILSHHSCEAQKHLISGNVQSQAATTQHTHLTVCAWMLVAVINCCQVGGLVFQQDAELQHGNNQVTRGTNQEIRKNVVSEI